MHFVGSQHGFAHRVRPSLYGVAIFLCATAIGSDDSSLPISPSKRIVGQRPSMGTVCRVATYDTPHKEALAAIEACGREIDIIESLMSDYRPDSEISQLPVRSASAPPPHFVRVDRRTIALMRLSQEISKKSGGAFDITAGALSKLWRQAKQRKSVPSDGELEAARKHVGSELLQLRPDRPEAACNDSFMSIDLGGIAKGFAADAGLAEIRARGIRGAIVSLGGDIAIGSVGSDGVGYAIGIAPSGLESSPLATLRLADVGISTSGDAEQSWRHADKIFSHILDPRTGWPLEASYSVTVIAKSAALADGMATALSVLGPEAGLPWLETWYPSMDVLFAAPDRDTVPRGRYWMNAGMARRLTDSSQTIEIVEDLAKAAQIVHVAHGAALGSRGEGNALQGGEK